MKIVSFFRLDTGLFTGETFCASSAAPVHLNTPDGCGWKEGRYDALSQRVDLDSREVVDWQPPQPDENHEWNAITRRWIKRHDVREREVMRARAIEEIEDLERAQNRALREIALGDVCGTARERLASIDGRIASLRAILQDRPT